MTSTGKNNEPRDAILLDLDIQWRDHFHMRDQTWKTLSNAALVFLGVVGLEIKGTEDVVMIPAYIVLVITSIFGVTVAAHHRSRQKQKFAMITKYENLLGLTEHKTEIVEQDDGIAGKIFTAGFIEIVHSCIGIVAIALLINKFIN